MKRKVSASKATYPQLLRLGRDNLSVGNYWIITDADTVSVTEQEPGKIAVSTVTVPRDTFNRLIRWYLRPQVIKGAKSS